MPARDGAFTLVADLGATPRTGGRTETVPPESLGVRLGATIAAQVLRDARDQFLREVVRWPPRRPWMKHREIAVLSELVRALRPRRALEWGAGYSTLYFPTLLPPGARWTAIEHDGAWAEIVRRRRPGPGAQVVHVPADRFPWTDEDGDGAYEDLRSYVDAAARYAPLDFILVDGRARRACVRRSLDWIADRGVVVLHDANRAAYRAAFDGYPQQLLLLDHRVGSGGLWIGSRGASLDELLHVDWHRRLWRLYSRIGAFVRL